MALKDIFDGDPRSKEELRRELAEAERRAADAVEAKRDVEGARNAHLARARDLERQLGEERAAHGRTRGDLEAAQRMRQEERDEIAKVCAEREALGRCKEELDQKSSELDARGEALSRQWEKLEGLRTTLEAWQSELNAAIARTDRDAAELKEHEARIRDVEHSLGKRADDLASREAAVVEQERRVVEAESKVASWERNVKEREGFLTGRDKLLAAKLEAVSAREDKVGQKEVALAQREVACGDREKLVRTSEQTVAKRESAVTVQERDAGRVAQHHEATARELDERERVVSTQEKSLAPRLAKVEQAESRLAEKLKRIEQAGSLDVREANAASRERGLSAREATQEALESSLHKAQARELELEAANALLATEIKGTERKQAKLVKERDAEAARADKEREKRKKLAKEVKELRLELRWPLVLRVNDEGLLARLVGLHAASVQEEVGVEVVTVGSEPLPIDVFDEALRQVGFVPQLLDDEASSFEVFVVGREGVDLEVLSAAIQARLSARTVVRLYSHELWLVYLVSGVDPLEMPEDVLRASFGDGHPVLAQFLGPPWNWPRIRPPVPPARDASPLHNFGYRAGKGTIDNERHAMLAKFFGFRDLMPYFDPNEPDAYIASWGSANSRRRLSRMATHIRWLVASQGRDARKKKAKRDWLLDLEWMRSGLRKEG